LKVVLTEQSLDRLESSLRFYLDDLQIPIEKVVEIKNELISSAESLAAHPFLGQHEPYLIKLRRGYRRIIKGNFKIIYRIEGEIIYVVDFFDSRDDPRKMIG